MIFVGIDVIGGYLTEINVTSPTGIREIKRFGGPDIAPMIWDAIETPAEIEASPFGVLSRVVITSVTSSPMWNEKAVTLLMSALSVQS